MFGCLPLMNSLQSPFCTPGDDEPDEPYYRACEEIFLEYGGKPHWGKVSHVDGEQLAAAPAGTAGGGKRSSRSKGVF